MIDSNEATRVFKEKFDKMTPQEQEKYLKDMGFVFAEKKSEGTLPKRENIQKDLMDYIILKNGKQFIIENRKGESKVMDTIELKRMINQAQKANRYMNRSKSRPITSYAKKRG